MNEPTDPAELRAWLVAQREQSARLHREMAEDSKTYARAALRHAALVADYDRALAALDAPRGAAG